MKIVVNGCLFWFQTFPVLSKFVLHAAAAGWQQLLFAWTSDGRLIYLNGKTGRIAFS